MACSNSRHHAHCRTGTPFLRHALPPPAHIPDRCCALAFHRWPESSRTPLDSFQQHLHHGSALWLRGLAKVCRAQTKFSALQQPCYCTSLKPRATALELTKGSEHYSVTWTDIGICMGQAQRPLACKHEHSHHSGRQGSCFQSSLRVTYLVARLNRFPSPLHAFGAIR
jgi:hypothetical protein